MYRTTRNNVKSVWKLVIFLLAGIVAGGFLGELAVNLAHKGDITWLDWLNYSKSFGLTEPLGLDLGVIALQFGFALRFSIAGVAGMIIAYLIHRRT